MGPFLTPFWAGSEPGQGPQQSILVPGGQKRVQKGPPDPVCLLWPDMYVPTIPLPLPLPGTPSPPWSMLHCPWHSYSMPERVQKWSIWLLLTGSCCFTTPVGKHGHTFVSFTENGKTDVSALAQSPILTFARKHTISGLCHETSS